MHAHDMRSVVTTDFFDFGLIFPLHKQKTYDTIAFAWP